jgi:hypothetical protein
MSHAAAPAATRSRWRFTFRLSTLFVVITIAAFACAGPRIYRQIQFWRFTGYVGKDIRELPDRDRERFEKLSVILNPKHNSDEQRFLRGQLESWVLWKLQTDKGVRFVLVQNEAFMMIPSGSNLHVSMFSASGDLLSRTIIPTGWRRRPFDARVVTDKIPGEPLMMVRVGNVLFGGGGPDQFYAFLNDKPVLVRLEYEKALSANNYAHPNLTLGSEKEPRAKAELLSALSSRREAEILQALEWFSGEHDESLHQRPVNLYLEELDQALLYQSLCRDPATQSAIQSLTNHPHPWVAEAAAAALKKLPVAEGE